MIVFVNYITSLLAAFLTSENHKSNNGFQKLHENMNYTVQTKECTLFHTYTHTFVYINRNKITK